MPNTSTASCTGLWKRCARRYYSSYVGSRVMHLPQWNLTHCTALNLCENCSAAASTHLMLAKRVLAYAAHYSQTNRRTDSRLEGSCSSIHGTTKPAVAAGGSSHEPQWLPCSKSGDNRYAHPFVGNVQRIPRPRAACESCGVSGMGLVTKRM